LDQFLSAVARLNPGVNVKAIVIGLMDRLSAYAAQQSEAESPEQRKQLEEDSLTKLLNDLKIAKEAPKPPASRPNGEDSPAQDATADTASESTAVATDAEETPKDEDSNGEHKSTRGIPDDIKLFEIFHEQVTSLVKLQRLQLWDTIALLVSLTNLAL
jgi:vacuolar protein sorting-associated protein 35